MSRSRMDSAAPNAAPLQSSNVLTSQILAKQIVAKKGYTLTALAKELGISISATRSILKGTTQNPTPTTWHRLLCLYSATCLHQAQATA